MSTPGFGPPGGVIPGWPVPQSVPYPGPFPQPTISTPLAPPGQQLTNASTLITGKYLEAGVLVFRNGVLMTEGFDYTRSAGSVTFVVPPQAGDVLTAQVFSIGKQLGGATPLRYVSPWALPLLGAFDGVGTLYGISFGPTIMGNCDGKNPIFVIQVMFQRLQVWRNGILQTAMQDYNAGPTVIAFLPGSIPQPGDLLTVLGYNNC